MINYSIIRMTRIDLIKELKLNWSDLIWLILWLKYTNFLVWKSEHSVEKTNIFHFFFPLEVQLTWSKKINLLHFLRKKKKNYISQSEKINKKHYKVENERKKNNSKTGKLKKSATLDTVILTTNSADDTIVQGWVHVFFSSHFPLFMFFFSKKISSSIQT